MTKFIFVQAIIRDFDIVIISELKLDNTFPDKQFKTDFNKMFRFDRNRYGEGLILCSNEKGHVNKTLNDHTILMTPQTIIIEFHQS